MTLDDKCRHSKVVDERFQLVKVGWECRQCVTEAIEGVARDMRERCAKECEKAERQAWMMGAVADHIRALPLTPTTDEKASGK